MCGFQYRYNGEDGYAVRCKKCGNYQIAFASFMLTLSPSEFRFVNWQNIHAVFILLNQNEDARL